MSTLIPQIIVADDHSMIRKGIKLLLLTKFNCTNVDEADSCHALMNELKKAKCTHLILDVVFPDGTSLEMAPVIRKLYPEIKIMIYSMQLSEIYASAFAQYGIYCYLSKSSTEEETIQYITKFLNNECALRPTTNPRQYTNPFSSLSPRELEILHYLVNGQKTNEIARALNLSNSTISTFKMRIFE